MVRMVLLAASLLSLAAGCVRAAPTGAPPPPAPAPLDIPPGCEVDLSGHYVHQDNATFQYAARDDGGAVRLDVLRVLADAGLPEGGAVQHWVELQRTARGFVGATHAPGFTASGAECRVQFPTELTACHDGGLVLRAAASVAIDEGCAPDARSTRRLLEHRLLRAP